MTDASKRLGLGLFLVFLLPYGWFFQGGGWNQNSRFDVVRALVERGTLEIGPWAANTGDVARVGDAVLSNKPPGLSILAAPVYAGALLVERALGLDPAARYVQTANAHLVTWAVSGVPAAALVALVFVALQGVTGRPRQAVLMAAAFGTGSLVLPYSGVMTNHVLVALGLFVAWWALERERASAGWLLAGGAGLGAAVFVEYLVAPLLALYAVLWWHRRGEGQAGRLFWVGPAVGLVALLALNATLYGGPFRVSYETQNPVFRDPDLLLGVFHLPDPRRLFWLTVHPYRGLFWCCPLFLLALPGPWRELGRRRLAFCLALVGYFLLFSLSFVGWTGGWGIGSRYLLPALPFLFLLAAEPWRRFPFTRGVLVTLSIVFMGAATSTLVMVPGPSEGPPPPGRDPVMETLVLASRGQVSYNRQAVFERFPGPSPDPAVDDRWDSYNVGELLGLRGLWSVLPVVLVVAGGVATLAMRAEERSEGGVQSASVAEGAGGRFS